jgi:hypothetical protein
VVDHLPIVIPGKGHNRELTFTGDFKEAIFGKHVMKMPVPLLWDSPSIKDNHEKYNEYTLNNYNYRGPDFVSGIDVITAGCSQTFGIGVPDNGPWPVHLAESLGASYVNLSMPGASVEWIINSIYRYIDTFGPPKRGIVILFPDILRNDIVINSDINTATKTNIGDFIPQYYSDDSKFRLISYSPMGYPAPNYIKKPYPVENTVVMEESVKSAILKIKDLERFCKYAGIKLVWSSWADSLVWLMRDIPEQYSFDNYVRIVSLADWKSHIHPIEKTPEDPEGIADYKLDHIGYSDITGCTKEMALNGTCICFSRCHFDRFEEFSLSFHEGTDRIGQGNSHYGVHKHMHIADDLVARALEIGL